MKCFEKLLLLLTVAVLLTQCGPYSYHPQLVLLDSLAECNADSAVSLMQQIKPLMAEADERDRRYYELLSIKVADKADLLLPTDTTAWQLVDWYEQHGDRRLLPMAYYYAARVCRTRNDSPQALDYLLKARDLLRDDDGQLHLKAVVNSQTGYILWLQKLYANALNSFEQAFYCDSILRDTLGMIYNMRDIANTYENLGKRDSCIQYMRKALGIAQSYNNGMLKAEIGIQMANVYCKVGQIDNALKLICEIKTLNDGQVTALYSIKADIYDQLEVQDSAEFYYEKLVSQKNLYAKEHGYRKLSDYAFDGHRNDSAYSYFSKYRLYSDSVGRITITNIVAQMYSLYNFQQKERENAALKQENETNKRVLTTVMILALLLFLVIIIIYLYYRSKNITLKVKVERRKRVKAIQEIAAFYMDELSAKRSLLEDSEVVKTIRKKLNDSRDINKVLSNEVWDKLELMVEQLYPNFKDQIAEVIKLTPFKLNVCLLLKTGFSNADISRLTQHSVEAVTSARRRMAQTAFGKKCAPSDWDSYIETL